MNILFWLYKSKVNKLGLCPLWVRITINGEREQFSTGINVVLQKWKQDKQLVAGNSNEAAQQNEQLRLLKLLLNDTYNQLTKENTAVSAFEVRAQLRAGSKASANLLETYIAHNAELKKLVGVTHKMGTLKHFKSNLTTLKEYIQQNFTERDLVLKRLTHKFLRDYSIYLLTTKSLANATVHKHLQRLNKVVNYAVLNDMLDKNPFLNFKFKLDKKEIKYLSKQELELLESKYLPIERLARVRDFFIFQCYTGLAYSDLKNLQKEQIQTGVDGELWIFGNRTKNNSVFHVPLLPRAMQIIQKYPSDTALVFNTPSNVKTNAYLKEIGTICGIKQDLCTHLARKTFCTTVTLLNGVPMETVSKMVGHSSIRVTESAYAKVLDEKIGMDMAKLKLM